MCDCKDKKVVCAKCCAHCAVNAEHIRCVLLEACEKALMNSTRSRSADCVFCGAAIGEEHAEDCPTMTLRAAIRAAREG